MRIEMKMQIQGSRNGVRWPAAGTVIDLPDGEARDLISIGVAEPVVAQPEKKVASKATTRKA